MFFSPSLRAAALLLCLGAIPSCSPAPRAAALPAPPSDPTAPGLVWRVSGGNVPFFLAGSFHLLRPSDYPLPSPYEAAWRQITHLVLEIAPDDSARPETQLGLKSLITLPSGTLQERLTPTTWQSLATWAQRTQTPLATLQTQPPWMAALSIAVARSRQLGFRSDQGLETHFAARLPSSGKTVEGLETVLGQMALFSHLPAPTQEALLRQSLAEADQLEEKTDRLIQAWRSGDAAALHATLLESFRDFPEIKKLLLDDRNAAWIPRLQALLQGDRPTLVLVGAGHLCGPGSLIDLLQAKGYRCIPLPAEAVQATPKAA